MTLVFLIATLLALAAGPLLYAVARREPRALGFLDGFLLISISGLVLLEVVPEAVLSGGPWSVVFLVAGLFGPTLLERAFRRAEREAHILALALAVAGLILHALADGVVLSPAEGDWALPLAVALHSLPVGMAVWWLLAPHFGVAPPLLALAAMGAGTIAGWRYGVPLEAILGGPAWSWLQSLVAGSILHVVFGRPHLHGDEDPHHEHVERVADAGIINYKRAGAFAALAGLAVLAGWRITGG